MTINTSNTARRPFSFEAASSPAWSTPEAAPSQAQETPREKYRVLVVEDDVSIARMIAANLHKAGIEFQCASTGVLGVRAFEENPPHLVLLDLMLPGMNGFQVCETIRKSSRIPVIMMTARVETTHQMRGFRLGADDYVLKPFDPQLLVARVLAHLRRVYAYDHGLQDEVVSAQNESLNGHVVPPPGQRQKDILSHLPEGWAGCGACNYMGPLKQFPRRYNGLGQDVLTCPHCKAEKMTSFCVD